MDELNARLDELILNLIEEINMDDSEDESKAVDELAKLYKVRADQEKNTNEFDAKIREIELKETESGYKLRELDLRSAELENRVRIDNDNLEIKGSELDLKQQELDLKTRELENATAHCEEDRKIHLGLEIANTVLPIVLYSFWLVKGFKFEETGVLRSSTFKSITSKMRPFKKWW
jgi:GAF domain-containing protein